MNIFWVSHCRSGNRKRSGVAAREVEPSQVCLPGNISGYTRAFGHRGKHPQWTASNLKHPRIIIHQHSSTQSGRIGLWISSINRSNLILYKTFQCHLELNLRPKTKGLLRNPAVLQLGITKVKSVCGPQLLSLAVCGISHQAVKTFVFHFSLSVMWEKNYIWD